MKITLASRYSSRECQSFHESEEGHPQLGIIMIYLSLHSQQTSTNYVKEYLQKRCDSKANKTRIFLDSTDDSAVSEAAQHPSGVCLGSGVSLLYHSQLSMTSQQQHLASNHQDQNFDHSLQNYICFILTRSLPTKNTPMGHKTQRRQMAAMQMACLPIVQFAWE